jgi:hypothetical protein
VLVIAALFCGGASSAAQPGAKAIAAPVVTPLRPARPLTGTLAVEAPPGAQVLIGSTVYPAGDLELPPGQYRVTLRRRARARGVVRRVTIAAGTVTPIKL